MTIATPDPASTARTTLRTATEILDLSIAAHLLTLRLVQERGITFSPATGRRELTTGVAPMQATRPGNLRPGSSLCVEYLSARFDDDREGYEDAALVGDGGEEAAEHRADDGGDRAGDGESAVEADQLGAGVDVTAASTTGSNGR
jgi:hypothetical protein